MGYLGKEGRIHGVFVTRNREYHVRRKVCVGVRERRDASGGATVTGFFGAGDSAVTGSTTTARAKRGPEPTPGPFRAQKRGLRLQRFQRG